MPGAAACDLMIFDCDGVLVDSEILATKAMTEVLNAAGIPATEAMVARCFGMKQADILASIARDTGMAIPAGVSERLWPVTRDWFTRALRPMPGVERFLDRLGDLPRCVASSSSPERIRLSLALTGLDRFFGENVFSSQQVARGKPAPDLFLFAASAMRTEPTRAVVIEDSIYGVRGAKAAGMRVYGYLGGSHIGAGHGGLMAEAGVDATEASWDALARHILDRGEPP